MDTKKKAGRSPQEVLQITKEGMDNLPAVTKPLLEWYGKYARTLPWREEPTPYHIWISEIMLQQTRVEAVKGYYARFLQTLPDIKSLADAEDDLLLKLWEGLGYYNRARNLKKAAGVVMQEFDGKLPASYGALLSLPGIGAYTAGAVASIAFGIPVPAVDGNVLRVFSRILASYADIAHPHTKEALAKLLPVAIPPDKPGDFNQAVMELGATVCIPNGAPLCGQCPVSGLCMARKQGIQDEVPVKTAKKERRIEERTVIFIVADGKVLLCRRGESGLLSGMYEPLNVMEVLDRDAASKAVNAIGHPVEKLLPLRDAKHIFTHVEWRMKGFLAYTCPFPAPEGWLWADAGMLADEVAVPSAFQAYTKELPCWLEGI